MQNNIIVCIYNIYHIYMEKRQIKHENYIYDCYVWEKRFLVECHDINYINTHNIHAYIYIYHVIWFSCKVAIIYLKT